MIFFNVVGKEIEQILIDFPTSALILSDYLGQKDLSGIWPTHSTTLNPSVAPQ